MTAYAIQPTFGRGELSPRLHARADVAHYQMGLAECENFIVLRQGGLRRRPGTQYIAHAKDQGVNNRVRLVPFVFSPTQAYTIEFGNQYLRFYANGGQVLSGGVPYEIVTPWVQADLDRLHVAQSNDVLYVVHPGYAPRKIKRLGETNWTIETVVLEDGPYLEINASATALAPQGTGMLFPAAVSANAQGAGYEAVKAYDGNPGTAWSPGTLGDSYIQYNLPSPKIVTGYALQVPPLGSLVAPRSWRVEGSADGSTFTTLDTRSGETGWGDNERRYYTFANAEPFLFYRLYITDVNDSESLPSPVQVAEWALGGGGADAVNLVLNATSLAGINNGAGFVASDVGRHIRLLSEDAYWHWGTIEQVTAPNEVVLAMRSPPLPSLRRITGWRLGAFSQTTGFPGAVSFYGERLVYGGTTANPQTVWGSRTGDLDDFGTSIPALPDDGFSLTIREGGAIQWLAEGSDLQIGMRGLVRGLGPADKNEGFSATNFNLTKPARGGAAPIQPAFAGEATIFVSKFGTSVQELVYSYEANGYVAPDLGVLSEHVFRPGVKALAFAKDPNAILWCCLNDGSMVGVTYEREQQMVAVHRHSLGGGGLVQSLCVIPGADRDELWLCVWREGIGRTIERMASDFEGEAQAEAFYVDSGLTYRGVPVSSVTGLAHLNGVQVALWADGAAVPDQTVSGGAAAVADGLPASVVHVGIPFESRATTLRVPGGGGDGSGLGRKKRVKRVIVDVMETASLKVKAAGRSEETILRSTNDAMDAAPALVTGSKAAAVDDRWDHGGVVTMIADGAGPATIRAVTPAYETEP